MNDDFESTLSRYKMEAEQKWLEWAHKIPPLQFPSDWLITIIPPFAAAMVRFWVHKVPGHPERRVSVYLDCFGTLGSVDQPYWEIYPNDENDNERFLMADTAGLLEGIRLALEKL